MALLKLFIKTRTLLVPQSHTRQVPGSQQHTADLIPDMNRCQQQRQNNFLTGRPDIADLKLAWITGQSALECRFQARKVGHGEESVQLLTDQLRRLSSEDCAAGLIGTQDLAVGCE